MPIVLIRIPRYKKSKFPRITQLVSDGSRVYSLVLNLKKLKQIQPKINFFKILLILSPLDIHITKYVLIDTSKTI